MNPEPQTLPSIPPLDTLERVREAVAAAEDRKALDLKVLHLQKISDFTDYFMICSGTSERQVQAIADGIVEKAKAAGRKPFGVEGYNAGRWVLIDLGDVVVHAFVPEERELYRLERLWGDAPVVLRIA